MRRYGLLLPHFGRRAGRDLLLRSAVRAEELGFDSLWVRDHLVYRPHEHEEADASFVEAFTTLTAVGAVTSRIHLGFAVMTLYRHPIHTAVLLGSLDEMSGGGRLEVGWGLGGWKEQLDLVGLGGLPRGRLLAEQVEAVRALLTGRATDHEGEHYRFSGVRISPVPAEPIPIYCGGVGPRAVARAARYGDGWLPGRLPLWRFRELYAQLRERATEHGRPVPDVTMPVYVSPAETVEQGARAFDLEEFSRRVESLHGPPPSGAYRSFEDLDLAAVAGPPDEIVRAVRAFQDAGLGQFVFDLRARHDDFEPLLEHLGAEVLPRLHEGDGR